MQQMPSTCHMGKGHSWDEMERFDSNNAEVRKNGGPGVIFETMESIDFFEHATSSNLEVRLILDYCQGSDLIPNAFEMKTKPG